MASRRDDTDYATAAITTKMPATRFRAPHRRQYALSFSAPLAIFISHAAEYRRWRYTIDIT